MNRTTTVNIGFVRREKTPNGRAMTVTKNLVNVVIHLPPSQFNEKAFRDLVRKHAPKGGDWSLMGYALVESKK